MTKKKPVNWAAIKKRYLTGEKPKDIAEDFGLTAKQVSNKAQAENWTSKKQQIAEKVANVVESELEEIHSIYGGLIKDIGKEFAEARKAGLIGLTVQDGEGFPNKLVEHVIKAGLASYLEKQKQAAKLTEPDEAEPPGFNISQDA